MQVEIESPCQTRPKILIAIFDEEKTIAQKPIPRQVKPSHPEHFDMELTEVPPGGTELTAFVWTRCESNEPMQGVDTCLMPR